MERPRVFEIANEFGVDTRSVFEVLRDLGDVTEKPENRLSVPVARRVRAALTQRFPERAAIRQAEPPSPRKPIASTSRKIEPPYPRQREHSKQNFAAGRSWREVHQEAVRGIIPETYAALRTSTDHPEKAGIAVVFHDSDAARPYGVCTISGAQHEAFEWGEAGLWRALVPLREVHRWYRDRQKDAPNVYIAFDLGAGYAWYGRSLEIVQNLRNGPLLDAKTLDPVSVPTVPTTGQPPRLALRAQRFTPHSVPSLRSKVSDGVDRPEEAFLLREDFLMLAVDSLNGAEVLDPLPVHVNALWVFARPIIMQRSDGSDRHVRAVWFRQGEVMWRIRTYTAGSRMKVKQVGDQLAGRKPFVAVWDDTRPEQKLLAAIWALMSQGGVTESETHSYRDGDGDGQNDESAGQLTIVNVKAGTDHAIVYGRPGADGPAPRESWSVRGHWRHQPYPSLGHDEIGKTMTKPIWISSYVKGSETMGSVMEKVITVRS